MLVDMSATPHRDPEDRTSLRDAGLRRLRDTRRWIAGGAVVLTGAFAGLAAFGAKHDNSASAGATQGAQSSQTDSSGDGGLGGGFGAGGGFDRSGGGAQLQSPSQAPQQAPGGSAPQSRSCAS